MSDEAESEPLKGEVVEQINKADVKPIHAPGGHEHKVALDGDELGEHVAVKCVLPTCQLGWFIPKARARELGLL